MAEITKVMSSEDYYASAAHRVSVRYLHLLFKPLGRTVSSQIREQRLLRCRGALLSRKWKDWQVAEIAYQQAFRDPAHFTRVFSKRFGESPSFFDAIPIRGITPEARGAS